MVKKNMINGCSRPVCVDLYHLAPKGATNCESGYPMTSTYCDKAVAILARRNNKTPGRALQTGSGGKCGDGGWGSVPRGCSAQTGGDWAAHLKTSGINCNNGSYQLVCTGPGKQVIKPPVRCPKYIVRCKRGQRKVKKKLKNGCFRPVCLGKPRCPVYRPIPCKDGQKMVTITMKNGCKRPICKSKCCRKFGDKVSCSIKYCSEQPVTQAPVTQEPEQPVTQAPVTQGPEQPVTQGPEQPVTQGPEQPVTQEPEQPVTQAPTKPDEPSKPVTQAP